MHFSSKFSLAIKCGLLKCVKSMLSAPDISSLALFSGEREGKDGEKSVGRILISIHFLLLLLLFVCVWRVCLSAPDISILRFFLEREKEKKRTTTTIIFHVVSSFFLSLSLFSLFLSFFLLFLGHCKDGTIERHKRKWRRRKDGEENNNSNNNHNHHERAWPCECGEVESDVLSPSAPSCAFWVYRRASRGFFLFFSFAFSCFSSSFSSSDFFAFFFLLFLFWLLLSLLF